MPCPYDWIMVSLTGYVSFFFFKKKNVIPVSEQKGKEEGAGGWTLEERPWCHQGADSEVRNDE